MNKFLLLILTIGTVFSYNSKCAETESALVDSDLDINMSSQVSDESMAFSICLNNEINSNPNQTKVTVGTYVCPISVENSNDYTKENYVNNNFIDVLKFRAFFNDLNYSVLNFNFSDRISKDLTLKNVLKKRYLYIRSIRI